MDSLLDWRLARSSAMEQTKIKGMNYYDPLVPIMFYWIVNKH